MKTLIAIIIVLVFGGCTCGRTSPTPDAGAPLDDDAGILKGITPITPDAMMPIG